MVAKKRSGWQAVGLVLLMLGIACKPLDKPSQQGSEAGNATTQRAAWLSDLIQEIKDAPLANPPAKVYRYNYQDQEVYYVTGRCCDIPSKLFDVDGKLLCEPDGGITGKGDGRCPDFFETRTNETLIWEDKRES